jgi:hypothetical protein
VDIIKGLMAEADFVLNLHDGSGFYAPRWESQNRNPMRFGQSIIADASEYEVPSTGRRLALEELARRVIRRVNPQIRDERHHFSFNNHRTLEKNSPHREQRNSATYYALTHIGIPAFGVETSKDIPDYRVRVQYQTIVINAFLEEVGIVADHPPMTFDPPQLQYLLISVNRAIPMAVPNGDAIQVDAGDWVQIQGVVANYQRGITAFIEGGGSENDLQRPVRIEKDTRVLVRKDSQVFGRISIKIKERDSSKMDLQDRTGPRLNYFMVEVNGEKRAVENHGSLKVIKGDQLRLLDPATDGVPLDAMKVNFIGFVRDEKGNTGEDRGVPIRTARDLWPRYALDEDGSRYRIVALYGNSLLGEMEIELQPATLGYLVVGEPGAPAQCYENGMSIMTRSGARVHIMDVKSNVPENRGVTLQFRGQSASLEKVDDGWLLDFREGTVPGGEIIVTREGIPMGRVFVQGL